MNPLEPKKLRMTSLAAAALTLLLSANVAVAAFHLRLPLGPGSACAGGACAGGNGPVALAISVETGQGPLVTITNGTPPYTLSAELIAWSPLYGYEGNPAWDPCTPTALNGTAFLGSWWGNDAGGVVADCVPSVPVGWSPTTITAVPFLDQGRLGLAVYLYYDGTANSASRSGNGFQFQYRLTVTDSVSATATTGAQTAIVPGF